MVLYVATGQSGHRRSADAAVGRWSVVARVSTASQGLSKMRRSPCGGQQRPVEVGAKGVGGAGLASMPALLKTKPAGLRYTRPQQCTGRSVSAVGYRPTAGNQRQPCHKDLRPELMAKNGKTYGIPKGRPCGAGYRGSCVHITMYACGAETSHGQPVPQVRCTTCMRRPAKECQAPKKQLLSWNCHPPLLLDSCSKKLIL